MPRDFDELVAEMPPESQARARKRADAILATIRLKELRRAHKLSQQTLSKSMKTTQGEVSKIERRTDAYISTLRNYVESMNGKLRIVAEFPEGTYEITQFGKPISFAKKSVPRPR